MGRNRKFDDSQVLEDAMVTFWRHGYSGTSARHLEHSCGIHPGSLYHAFGSKEGLFHGVIDHYIETVVEPRIQQHLTASHPLTGIRHFFETAFDGPAPGCLLNNTCLEFHTLPAATSERVLHGMSLINQGFQELLQSGNAGLRTTEVQSLADHLAIAFQGFLVLGKLDPTSQHLARALKAVLHPLQLAALLPRFQK